MAVTNFQTGKLTAMPLKSHIIQVLILDIICTLDPYNVPCLICGRLKDIYPI